MVCVFVEILCMYRAIANIVYYLMLSKNLSVFIDSKGKYGTFDGKILLIYALFISLEQLVIEKKYLREQ